jgi:hypothetical protein
MNMPYAALSALLAALAMPAFAAEPAPAFYVVDLREEGGAMLHSTVRGVAAGTELPYVVTDPKAKIDCCFHVGPKPGSSATRLKAGIQSDVLYGDEEKQEKIFAYSGYPSGRDAAAAQRNGDIAFGLAGMSAVRQRGRDTWEVTLGQGAKPVFVRQCLGIEGIHIRLYRALRDRKPYADYYVPLGYDTEETCL